MASADVVSVHVPGCGSTPLVNADHIAMLKPTAYLINTARGDSIDEAALISALSEGRIGARASMCTRKNLQSQTRYARWIT
jgi:lactate dehydrogenase-like 2-hydroxyacid dehydrogenase